MNEDGFEKELCSVCGNTFRGARSHKDKPYKTCKNCLDSEDTGKNRSKHLMDRIDSLSFGDDNESINHKDIKKNIFNEAKKVIDNVLNIDSIFEVKELRCYYKANFLNVPFNSSLNKKLLSENNSYIFTSGPDNGLEISLRK